jgi:N-acetylglutamate synthase-like GNAT family acetyltransferase
VTSAFRSYRADDVEICLELLRSNIPEFFVPSDVDRLRRFLMALPGPFFVAESAGDVIACGGWALESANVAVLTWGIVRRDRHGQGVGGELLRFSIDEIRRDGRAFRIRLRTVQQVQQFFARYGFRSVAVVPNGFGDGFDQVTMDRLVDDVPAAG